jgi:hypothetical protein
MQRVSIPRAYADLIYGGIVIDDRGTLRRQTVNKENIIKNGIYKLTVVISGYGEYDVWRSNLQKCIRRGLIDGAVRSVHEMWRCNPVCASNVINRVCKVIVSEDVGCANPYLAIHCHMYLTKYNKLRTDDALRALCALVHRMCVSPKSRLCDHALAMVVHGGGPLGQGWFIGEVRRLLAAMNDDAAGGPSVRIQIDGKVYTKRKPVFKVWRDLLERASASCSHILRRPVVALFHIFCSGGGEAVLNLINASFLVHLYARKVLTDDILVDLERADREFVPRDAYVPNAEVWPLDCAYDKHTRIGAKLGRGIPHFLTEGRKLVNVPEWITGIERDHD